MSSKIIESLQLKLEQEQARLSEDIAKIKRPKMATGTGSDVRKENRHRMYEYERMVSEARDFSFKEKLSIIGGTMPETSEEYVELLQFMEGYHAQLTNQHGNPEEIPTGEGWVNEYNCDKSPEGIIEYLMSGYPVFQMKHRHYSNAANRFPNDPQISSICAKHFEQYNQIKENIKNGLEKWAQNQAQAEEKARKNRKNKKKKYILWTIVGIIVLLFFVYYYIGI